MITLSKLRETLKTPPGSDDGLKEVRASVVAQLEQLCGGLFDRRADHVQVIRPVNDRAEFLYLELGPVESILRVEERWRGGEWEELAVTEYELEGERRLNRTCGSFAPWVRVTYSGGYLAVPGVGQFGTPADLAMALVTQALFLQQRLSNEAVAVASKNFDAASTIYERADYHPSFVATATRYRRFA